MKNIKSQPLAPSEPRAVLESSAEDGFSLTRRSVLTEKLLPPRCTPAPRRRGRAVRADSAPVLLPF